MYATLDHLDELEAESIEIFREVASCFKNPVILYSVGKDSSVLLHLARKAFYPETPPFPLLHVDTSYKFQEMYDFRQEIVEKSGMKLLVHRNEEAIAQGVNPESHGMDRCCSLLKTKALLDALKVTPHTQFS